MTWTRVQTAILTTALVAPIYQLLLRLPPTFPGIVGAPCRLLGAIGLVVAIVPYVQARKALGSRLRIEPSPAAAGDLIISGVFGRVRHPMYAALVLGSVAWALLWNSVWGLFVDTLVVAFLGAKIRREEELLAEMYPAYAAYRRAVPALLPRFQRPGKMS
ncbi:MAG TPA: isoprenylcysteine carboxylmethyltransferase family protein [Chloroflexota bacterium]